MNYLGLDYGRSHIGVAIATGPLAQPLTTLKTSNALQLIKQLILDQSIDALVIGDADSNFLTDLKLLTIPVHQIDETLSSHDARVSLLHTTRSRRKTLEHSVSAAVILQSWLDSHSTKI